MKRATVKAKKEGGPRQIQVEAHDDHGIGIESVGVSASKPAEAEPLPEVGRCINCGQTDYPIEVRVQSYYCPMCHYEWEPAKEQAPFRRVQRGDL